MQVCLALFRGINVSGKKIIKMEALRHLMEDEGYADVKTFIQSGNVIFKSGETSKEKIKNTLEALIEKHYGFEVTIFILDHDEIVKAIDNNPFASNREPEGAGSKKLYVTFLSEVPSPDKMEALRNAPIGEDEIELVGNVLYFKLYSKASESKLSNNLIESRLKVKATTRNWNTTLKLIEMLDKK